MEEHAGKKDAGVDNAAKGSTARNILIGVVACIVFLVWAGFYIQDEFKSRHVVVTGTLVSVDTEARTASLSFIHPKSGEAMTITGAIPPDCEILVDGQPRKLADLVPGSMATVEATVVAGTGATATRILVESPHASSTTDRGHHDGSDE